MLIFVVISGAPSCHPRHQAPNPCRIISEHPLRDANPVYPEARRACPERSRMERRANGPQSKDLSSVVAKSFRIYSSEKCSSNPFGFNSEHRAKDANPEPKIGAAGPHSKDLTTNFCTISSSAKFVCNSFRSNSSKSAGLKVLQNQQFQKKAGAHPSPCHDTSLLHQLHSAEDLR